VRNLDISYHIKRYNFTIAGGNWQLPELYNIRRFADIYFHYHGDSFFLLDNPRCLQSKL